MRSIERPLKRVERAKHHLDDLNDQIARFLESEPYPITQEPDPDRGGYLFRIQVKAEIPDSIGLIFGDFVHNLRASLDNLMFELLGAPAMGWVRSFPVCSQPADFAKIVPTLRHQGSADAFRIIESVQPFHAADASDPRTRLRLLHDFWNEDKHRTTTPVVLANYAATAAAYRGDSQDKTLGFEAYFGEIQDGKVIGWVAGTEADRRPLFPVHIRFHEKPIVLAESLASFYQFVREDIFGAFEAGAKSS
jgi:hypothetical protein